VVVAASKAGQFIVWKFELEDFDVDFSVRFTPLPYEQPVELVHSRTRYLATSAGRPVEGEREVILALISVGVCLTARGSFHQTGVYRCVQAGKATLTWDNSYSRIRGFVRICLLDVHRCLSINDVFTLCRKNILYQVQVVDDSIMESANAAADALDEAFQAKKRREHDEEQATMSTALVVRSPTEAESGGVAALSLYKSFIPETLMQQGWLLSAPINVAGKVASRLFGSQEIQPPSEAGERNSDKEARSLLEELNGLNMRLMERLVISLVTVVTLSTGRQRSRCMIWTTGISRRQSQPAHR